jgi:hypothetical protein
MARIALALAAALTLALPAASPAKEKPATFKVGGATASISPGEIGVWPGGMGVADRALTAADENPGSPLEVRALYVSNGEQAIAFVTADAIGWFAANQGSDFGVTSAREMAAQLATETGGVAMGREDVMVQSSHSHASPTLMGIWGEVPEAYIKKVHDAVGQAVAEAAGKARTAHLEFGTFEAPWLNNIDLSQYDSYAGWASDGQVSVLRAVTPKGATVGSFVNVPAHPDIVCGACGNGVLSADYFGFAREELDERLGGVNIVSGATLGRLETPIQTDGLAASDHFSDIVDGITGRALLNARPITSAKLQSQESLLQVPASNPALLALNAAWALPPEQRQQMLDATGKYPINRSIEPPYLTGNAIGTWLTAFRVGDSAYLSMPGESFPEIRNGLEKATSGADKIVALGQAQDVWGYFYPAWVFPFTNVYASDHQLFNVAPHAGDQVILGHADNLRALGFRVDTAIGAPMPTDWEQALNPGVQGLASPTWGHLGSDGTLAVNLLGVYEGEAAGQHDVAGLGEVEVGDKPAIDGPIRWDFGDGTTGESQGGRWFSHVYDAPGRYVVKLAATDVNGKTATWQLVVRAYKQLRPVIEAERVDQDTWEFTGRARGGDRNRLAHRWAFGDGTRADGRRVRHTFSEGEAPEAALTVADGTTMTATTRWSAP